LAEQRLWERFGLAPTERFVELAEPRVRLRVVEVGSGAPVIFIPGTGGVGPYWAPLVRELAGFRCLLLDRPGWGLSSAIDYRGRDFGEVTAAILAGVMDGLGIEHADVVGASVGNIWALALAARRPAAVGRVVLIGGCPWREVPIPGFFRVLASPLGAAIVRMPLSPGATASQVRAIGHADSLADGRMEGFIDWRVSLTRETPSMRHERDMVKAYIGKPTWRAGFVPTDDELGRVTQSVRMVFGSDDTTGSPDVWQRFVGLLPHGELDLVEHAGHMAWWDQPERVGRSVRAFLSAST
jgi:pimeloyl-ACP methyl ester carboxylesterase